jgi:hypothetical protein
MAWIRETRLIGRSAVRIAISNQFGVEMKSPETLAQHPFPDFKAILLWKLAVDSLAHARTARAFSQWALNVRKMVNRRASKLSINLRSSVHAQFSEE